VRDRDPTTRHFFPKSRKTGRALQTRLLQHSVRPRARRCSR
jgi:hypothetical protein